MHVKEDQEIYTVIKNIFTVNQHLEIFLELCKYIKKTTAKYV